MLQSEIYLVSITALDGRRCHEKEKVLFLLVCRVLGKLFEDVRSRKSGDVHVMRERSSEINLKC